MEDSSIVTFVFDSNYVVLTWMNSEKHIWNTCSVWRSFSSVPIYRYRMCITSRVAFHYQLAKPECEGRQEAKRMPYTHSHITHNHQKVILHYMNVSKGTLACVRDVYQLFKHSFPQTAHKSIQYNSWCTHPGILELLLVLMSYLE